MLPLVGDAAAAALVSSAHCCLAPSIWRRLLMQAFCCAVLRALTKFGMAMADSKPMIATTIMISTRVKPRERIVVVLFIRDVFLLLTRRLSGFRLLVITVFCSTAAVMR